MMSRGRDTPGSYYFSRMDDFAKMDIFFVVATVAVVAHIVFATVIFWYALRLLRLLERIGREVEEEAKALARDLDEARAEASRTGRRFARLFDVALAAVTRFLGGTGRAKR
jgi:hypothetical protein